MAGFQVFAEVMRIVPTRAGTGAGMRAALEAGADLNSDILIASKTSRTFSLSMQLEFHQLDRLWEQLRVRHPARQRRLLASLAESGQQTPVNEC